MEYKLGDRVVYPNHGIGVIEDIENKEVSGAPCKFYCLRIISNDTVVMVPTQNATSVGLRRVIGKGEVAGVLKELKAVKTAKHASWKGRFKENSDRMRTGSLFEVAAVLKNLSQLSRSKSLSYREKRMLDKARQLVVSELAEVQHTPEENVAAQVDKVLTPRQLMERGH